MAQFTALLLLIFFTSCDCIEKVSGTTVDSSQKRTIDLMQGLWSHSEDSLASVMVTKWNWTFHYKGMEDNANDHYTISIKDKLPDYVRGTEKAEYLILSNKIDTLHYEILGITDSTLSLMYFPAGKIHLYKRHQ